MNRLTNGTTVFLAVLPTLERQARFAFRGLRDVHRFEDCVQETLALCWLWTCRLWAQGKDVRDFPTTLAGYAVRHVRSGRSLVGKKTHRSDVISPRAQRLHGFLTLSLPQSDAHPDSSWHEALEDNMHSPPDEQAAFRIDFPAFLALMSDRDRQVARDMMMGETTQELSARYRLTPGRISQMRRDFHKDWHAFAGEAV